MEDTDRFRNNEQRDRERSHRGNRPNRGSDGSRDRERDRSPIRADRIRKSPKNRVYVSNISYEFRWQELKDLFRNRVGNVSFVEMLVDDNDKFNGCAIVEFSDPESVKKCMEVMHREEAKGRRLIIKEDFGNERERHGNALSGGRPREQDRKSNWDDTRDRRERRTNWGDYSAESKWGPTWGLSPQFLESLGIDGPLVSRVFVANIDYKVDEKKLREVFKIAGRIVDLELYRDKDGNSRGFAVIDYDHPVESVQAISMFNLQTLYDRVLIVRMDRAEQVSDIKLPEGLKNIGMGLGVNGQPLRDVSRNLPTTSSTLPDMGINTGSGILGAVPNPGLQNLGTALSSVVNTPALAGLASASAALQGLAGVQNQLLANNLNELGFGNNSLMANSLAQNSALSALTGGNSNQNSLGSIQPFVRSDNRDYSSSSRDFDTAPPIRNNYENAEHDYRDDFRQQNNPQYNNMNNGSQRRDMMQKDNKYMSDTVLVNNLPPTVSWKMLREKFSSCGDIQYVEMKTKDSALIRFANDWEAERAIQLLNRSRVDGTIIEVRYF